MSDVDARSDRREDRELECACEVPATSRGQLDRLYEEHAPRVYRMALQCTASEAEAERVTEAVFLTVLRDLAAWMDGGPSLLLTIFGAARQEFGGVALPPAEVDPRTLRIATP